MKACEATEEKKRKKTMLGFIGGSSSSAPLKYCMVYMPPTPTSTVLGQPPAVLAVAAVQPYSFHSVATRSI
jgi:hypothetical protein